MPTEIATVDRLDFIGRQPKWFVKSGSAIILITLILLLLGSHFIKYPETIDAEVNLSSGKRAINVITNTAGYLNNLYVKDDDIVKKGFVLGELRNQIGLDKITKIENILKQIENSIQSEKFDDSQSHQIGQLGVFQNNYDNLLLRIQEFHQYLTLGETTERIQAIEKQLIYLKAKINLNEELKAKSKQKLQLTTNAYERDSLLYSQNVLSKKNYEIAKGTLLTEQNNFARLKSEIINNESSIASKEIEIGQLNLEDNKMRNNLMRQCYSSLYQLKSQIAQWKFENLLIAPIDGRISFNKILEENEYLTKGQEIIGIVPAIDSVYAYSFINQAGFGKVKCGHRAIIDLQDYPKHEFGSLIAEVSYISNKRSEDGYLVKMKLSNGLVTNYQEEISFYHDMTGSVRIITDDITLLQRYFSKLRALFNH